MEPNTTPAIHLPPATCFGRQIFTPLCLLLACAVERRRFPVGARPTRQPLPLEAIGAVMEVTKWLKPSISEGLAVLIYPWTRDLLIYPVTSGQLWTSPWTAAENREKLLKINAGPISLRNWAPFSPPCRHREAGIRPPEV